MNVHHSVKGAMAYLYELDSLFLMIFDNAEGSSSDLAPYLPRAKRAHIIITTSNSSLAQLASPSCAISLPDLDEDEAVSILLRRVKSGSAEANISQATTIVRIIGCQALTITLAAGTIAARALPLSDARSEFGSLLPEHIREAPNGFGRPLWTVFKQSYGALSPHAQLFMQILSRFQSTNIPTSVFGTAATALDNDQLLPGEVDPDPEARQMLRNFLAIYRIREEEAWDASAFRDLILELQDCSILRYNPVTTLISMHSLVHECARRAVARDSFGTRNVDILDNLHLLLITFGVQDASDVVTCHNLAQHIDAARLNPATLSAYVCQTLADILCTADVATKQLELRERVVQLDHLHLR